MLKKLAAVPTQPGSREAATIDLGHFAPYLVSRLHMHFQGLLLEHLDPDGLLVADWRTLICLSRHQKVYINDIVLFTSLPQATISRSVKRLESRGLLVKADARDDKRASLVRISAAGQKLVTQLAEQIDAAAEAELSRLMGDRSNAFIQMLRMAVRNSGLETTHDL